MPYYLKGSDNKARTIKNPLEGSSGDVSLGTISANAVAVTGNVTVGNILTDGYCYANGSPFTSTYGNSNVASYLPTYTGNIAGDVLYTPVISSDWANAAAIYNVALALNALANAITELQTGNNFTFPGPYSNDSQAAANGVAIGQIYFGSSGGLVVRQT